jgi:hypothetical protein
MSQYKLKSSVSCVGVGNTVVEDHNPRPIEFWGKQLEDLIKRGFIEEVKGEAKAEPKDEAKEDVKDKKKGV